MKRVYGQFCGGHNEAVNFYKDLLSKDKRFQVSVKVSLLPVTTHHVPVKYPV